LNGSDIEFDWDEANIDHIARHGVTIEEAEEAVLGFTVDLGMEIVNSEERSKQVGSTRSGRLLLLVTTWRESRIRVVTAFDANKQLAGIYYRMRN